MILIKSLSNTMFDAQYHYCFCFSNSIQAETLYAFFVVGGTNCESITFDATN